MIGWRPLVPDPASPHSDSTRDPYRGVVIVLLALALLGTLGALAGGLALGNPVLLDAAVTLGLSAGMLIGVALVQTARARPHWSDDASSPLAAEEAHEEHSDSHEQGTRTSTDISPVPVDDAAVRRRAPANARVAAIAAVPVQIWHWLRNFNEMGTVRVRTAVAGALAIALLLLNDFSPIPLDPLAAGIAAAVLSAVAAAPYLLHPLLALHLLRAAPPLGVPSPVDGVLAANVVDTWGKWSDIVTVKPKGKKGTTTTTVAGGGGGVGF